MTFPNAVLPPAPGALFALDRHACGDAEAAGSLAGAAAAPEGVGQSWGEALAALLAGLLDREPAAAPRGAHTRAGQPPAAQPHATRDHAGEPSSEPGAAAGQPHDENEWRPVPLVALGAVMLTPPTTAAPQTPATFCGASGGAADRGSGQPVLPPADGVGLGEVPLQPSRESRAAADSGISTEPRPAVAQPLPDAGRLPQPRPPAATTLGPPPAHAADDGQQAGATVIRGAEPDAGPARFESAPSAERGPGKAEPAASLAARETATAERRPQSRLPEPDGTQAVPAPAGGAIPVSPPDAPAAVPAAEPPGARIIADDHATAPAAAAGSGTQPPATPPPARQQAATIMTTAAVKAAGNVTPAPLAFAARLVERPSGPARMEAAYTAPAAVHGERSSSPAAADPAGPSAAPPRPVLPPGPATAPVARPESMDAPRGPEATGATAAEASTEAAGEEPKPSSAPSAGQPRAVSGKPATRAPEPGDDGLAAQAARGVWRSGETHLQAAAPAPGRPAAEANAVPPDSPDAPPAALETPRQHRDAPRAAQPAGELRLRLDRTADEPHVEVRVAERGGEVRVSVRTPDADLSRNLRHALPELIDGLDRRGYAAEIWRPGEADAAPPQRGEPRRTEAEPPGGGGPGHRDQAAGQGEPEPDRHRRPPAEAWEEIWNTSQGQFERRTTLWQPR